MRLIDADALKEKKVYSLERHEKIVPVAEIDWMPTIDAVPVVRCEDCKHYRKLKMNGIEWMECTITDTERNPDWFCADGTRP